MNSIESQLTEALAARAAAVTDRSLRTEELPSGLPEPGGPRPHHRGWLVPALAAAAVVAVLIIVAAVVHQSGQSAPPVGRSTVLPTTGATKHPTTPSTSPPTKAHTSSPPAVPPGPYSAERGRAYDVVEVLGTVQHGGTTEVVMRRWTVLGDEGPIPDATIAAHGLGKIVGSSDDNLEGPSKSLYAAPLAPQATFLYNKCISTENLETSLRRIPMTRQQFLRPAAPESALFVQDEVRFDTEGRIVEIQTNGANC